MEHFTPYRGILGGALIGLASASLLTFGKICGVSGIFRGALFFFQKDALWRVLFVLGLVFGAFVVRLFDPNALTMDIKVSMPLILVGGLFVGFGTTYGNGCTSGHGICGIGRLSVRSMVATIVFVGMGMATASILSWFWGL